jgi:hypothetical protein
MKALITASGPHGPFVAIARTESDDGWDCDGNIYFDGVIGPAKIGEYKPPPPTKDQINAPILAQIAALESPDHVTARRIREAVVTTAGKAWMVDVDKQIATLRASLVK